MCIAVVDGDGTLKAFSRMDGAPLLSVQIAQDKAYTAISFGMATHDWFDFVKDDAPLLHSIIKTDRLIVFGGGYPITTDAGIIGGIGVSGGHYTHDMEVAQAGLAALWRKPAGHPYWLLNQGCQSTSLKLKIMHQRDTLTQ